MSPRIFFITGRPRSRTAWLANYLTWGDTFCFHDALRSLRAPEQLADLFARVSGAAAIGHADPANLFFQRTLLHRWPEAQWIVIDRPTQECAEAAAAAFGEDSAPMEIYDAKIAELKTRTTPLVVAYDALNQYAPAIGQAVRGPQWRCPQARHALLTRLQVQILPSALAAGIAGGLHPELLTHAER